MPNKLYREYITVQVKKKKMKNKSIAYSGNKSPKAISQTIQSHEIINPWVTAVDPAMGLWELF